MLLNMSLQGLTEIVHNTRKDGRETEKYLERKAQHSAQRNRSDWQQ